MVPVYEGATQEARRKVTVTGNPEAQWKAQYLIYEKLREEGFSGAVEDVKLTVEIRVPSSQVCQKFHLMFEMISLFHYIIFEVLRWLNFNRT